jgi:transcriptional regulator with XRE-family HTH domain
MSFATRLRSIRERRDLTQERLSRAAKIHVTQISHFEAGQREPNADNIRRLAQALDVTADYLLELSDETRRIAS